MTWSEDTAATARHRGRPAKIIRGSLDRSLHPQVLAG